MTVRTECGLVTLLAASMINRTNANGMVAIGLELRDVGVVDACEMSVKRLCVGDGDFYHD